MDRPSGDPHARGRAGQALFFARDFFFAALFFFAPPAFFFFAAAFFFFDFGQPFSIWSYDSFEIVERFFGRLLPAFLRRLMFATSEFFFFAAMRRG